MECIDRCRELCLLIWTSFSHTTALGHDITIFLPRHSSDV
jgi:hypothetical protein